MAALASLSAFTDGRPMEVTVGGEPLTMVVAKIVRAMQQQHTAFEELRDYTYRTNAEQWERIAALEASVARLDDDVGIQQRPLLQQPTLLAATLSLERRITALNHRRQATTAATLMRRVDQARLLLFFKRWSDRARLRHAAHTLFGTSRLVATSLRFAAWRRWLQLRQARRTRERKVRGLFHVVKTQCARAALSRWQHLTAQRLLESDAAREQRKDLAAKMAALALRGHARLRFMDWKDFAAMRHRRHQLVALCDKMAIMSHRAVAKRAFEKWQIVEVTRRGGRVRRALATCAATAALRSHTRLRFQRWLGWVQRARGRRVAAKLVPRLHHQRCLDIARKYFATLRRHVMVEAKARETNEIHSMFDELGRRCDVLGSQLDVAAKAIGSTNQALSKLAHRINAVESR
jgi:hypothetical protein